MSPVVKKKRKKITITSQQLLLVLTAVCAFLLIFTFNTNVFEGVLKQAAGYVVVPFQNGIATIGGYLSDRSDELAQLKDVLALNKDLQEQIDQLTIENNQLQQDRYELNNLRSLYELDQAYSDYDKIGARVISSETDNWFSSFTINKGEVLGFLAGDQHNMVDPYLRPLYEALFDMMGPENFQKYQERGAIEVAPLAYMRGRTLDDSFIILDEAQNTTREQMKMFLTRLGFGSKIVITGDTTQIDLPPDKISGLKDAVRVLDGVKDIAICRLTAVDVVRHALVQEIIKAYERHERPKEPEKKPDIRKKQK